MAQVQLRSMVFGRLFAGVDERRIALKDMMKGITHTYECFSLSRSVTMVYQDGDVLLGDMVVGGRHNVG
jgi:hypothetical protein